MSASIWKLKALLKKNFYEMKRNIISTLIEIFFPIIVILLLYTLKIIHGTENYIFEKEEGSLENYIKNNSVYNPDIFPELNFSNMTYEQIPVSEDTYMNIPTINPEIYGMTIRAAFNICSIINRRLKIRDLIATIGVPDEIKKIMINESIYFLNYTGFILNESNFKDFKNEEDMNKYIKSEDYGETEEMPLICFGISFSRDKINHKYDYSLHYFDSYNIDGAEDVPKTYNIQNSFLSYPDFRFYNKYKYSGYTYIMKIINDYIYSQEINNETKINFGIIPMIYNDYDYNPFLDEIGFLGPFFVIVAYIGNLCIYVYNMVYEKQTKVKEGMKIMGLTDGIYFLSYFIRYIIISFVDSLIIACIFLLLFTKIPFIINFLMIFLFSINIFSLAFCFQSFIDKAKESLLLSLIIYFTMFFFYLLVMNDNVSYNMKLGFSIFPQVVIFMVFNLLGKFESNSRQFYLKDISYIYTNYSILIMFIALIIDNFIYLFIGYYLQNILKHEFGIRKPWYFLFTPKYWGCKKRKKNLINQNILILEDKDELLIDNNENFQNEDIYKEMIEPKNSLKIKNIYKQFDDGKIAVNRISLNLYKNEIFALLGHNGAGKTTLISMLIGLYEATDGEVIYNNMNILLPENISEFRKKLGICPQHDVLFKDLNVREHLEMFSVFKGVPQENIESEINKIIKDFQLEDIQYTLAKNLSGGQRRKLSIGISLIGGSEIIFLDEPSSSIDTISKRNLWKILKKQCDNKIIILTTHNMEEASILGKRIGIINNGKMKCIGTPLFLIEKFGKYMNIILYKDKGAINNDICNYITNIIGEVKFETLAEEIKVQIDKNIFKNSKIPINKFFEELDNNLNILKIKSYSISMPTLEDAFLNVIKNDEKNILNINMDEHKDNDSDLFDVNYLNNYTYWQKLLLDFKSNIIRRFYLMIRDKKGFIMEIICPILLILIACITSKTDSYYPTPIFGPKDLPILGKQIIYYSALNESINKENYYIEKMINITNENLTEFDQYINELKDNKSYAIYKYMETFYNKTKYSENSVNNIIDMTSNEYIGYYGSLLLLNEPNELNKNYEFVVLINLRVAHGVPLFTSAFLNQIIRKASNNKVNINFQHKVMSKTFKQEEGYYYFSDTVVLFVAVAFSLIPANFIIIIVREKNNNSKHLMKLSGMNILSYWVVNFLYEIIKFYFTGGICIILLYIFDYYEIYLVHFYLLYGPPLIFMTYILSFLFNDESEAHFITILLNSLMGAIGSTMIYYIRQIDKVKFIGRVFEFILCLFPSFCFCFSYILTTNKAYVYIIDFFETVKHEIIDDESFLMSEFILLLGPLCFLIIDTIIYLIILILIEYLSKKGIWSENEKLMKKNVGGVELRDSGVVDEEIRAQNDYINIDNNEYNYKIRVKNLQKKYISSIYKIFYCCKKNKGKIAIKNLNFCLEKGECFGLLGLNGSGKTTAFKCITQEINPSYGEIYINGIKTNNNIEKIINKFGYCPQDNAIFDYLTVYENLEFYAKIKGVKKVYMSQIINKVISEMNLEEFLGKLARNLSGGNKRKLSFAISMLCSPPLILLDEPSCGMDPEAKRYMWSIISKLTSKAKKSSIILTTHSMDEAEILCKRIGIMIDGEFVCLGTSNEIKNKYGYGYELNIRIKPLTEKLKEELFFNKYNIDNNIKVNINNIENILEQINKINYMEEIKEGRLGDKLIKDIKKYNEININYLLNWIFYIENAIKFIKYGKDKSNFDKIIIEENIDNNFLFKIKKYKENNKSIGYLYGLFEIYKEECYISEYSLQQTSLEQIFNEFAEKKEIYIKKNISQEFEYINNDNISIDEGITRKNSRFNKIVLSDELIEKLLKKED